MPKRILSVLIAAALSAGIFTGCSSPQYEIELYDGNYSEVQLVHKMADNHFIFRFITENSDIHLITESLAFQKLRFLNQCPNFVQAFFYITHSTTLPPMKSN